ncbi:GNAT family N-acetyltransferase [Paenibacillus polygoni]|uniref:GNAT family N-acetyltransferase n=1 Tax=Paenibacillus polygoni TaxID=3050112 RepID=A0ABY8X500_9BACL|nr:GNAT family N-acetyltransferase [Paenibacillus polygoni]WIV20582.1 GNAT family N-acetyltransferase [Paenibacillus polygoni]
MQLFTRLASLEERPFLFQVYADTRKSEVNSWGWSEDQVKMFLQMQFDAQTRAYSSHPVPLKEEMIFYKDEPIGRILTRELGEVLVIVDIALLSEFHNRGFGTELITCYQQYAMEKGISIELHVLSANPVCKLYKRLGFVLTGEHPLYLTMKWTP